MKKLVSLSLLLAAALTSNAQLVNTLNFSTGYNNVSGTALTAGAQDPNWKVTYVQSPQSPAGTYPYDSYTQTPWTLGGFGNPVTPTNTQWISYNSVSMTLSAPQVVSDAISTYEYTFELCSQDYVSFNATMRSDNRISAIRVDGSSTGFSQTLTSSNWSTGSSFSYSLTLGVGSHTIAVDVLNSGIGNAYNPTGLNVDGNITSTNNSIIDRDNFPTYTCCNANFRYCMGTTNPYLVNFTPDDPSQPGTFTWYVNGAPVGTGVTFSYPFPGPGSYQVCLRYTNGEGQGCEKCINLCISDNPAGGARIASNSLNVGTVNKAFEVSKVYPNPTSAELNIEFQANGDAPVSIKLYDMMGKVVTEKSVTLQKGQKKVSVSTDGLPSGTYSLHLSSGETMIVEKIQVIK